MKRLLFLFIFTSSTLVAFATSGACSGHGGVDCTHIDYDGSVICMDGWEKSSVSYNSMVKCQGYKPFGSRKAPPSITVPIVVENRATTTIKKNLTNTTTLIKNDFIPKGATAICKDGTYSFSKTKNTICVGHKGVNKIL